MTSVGSCGHSVSVLAQVHAYTLAGAYLGGFGAQAPPGHQRGAKKKEKRKGKEREKERNKRKKEREGDTVVWARVIALITK